MRHLKSQQGPFVITLACLLLSVGVSAQDGSQSNGPKTPYQLQLEREWKLHPTLAIGAQAPDFLLPGVDGREHSLGESKSSRLLVVLFTCNHCPTAQLYEDRIKKLVSDYQPKGVGFVAIQPNAPAAASAHELNYSDVDDSLDSMIIRARFRNFNFPYLYDGDTQAIAHKYGVKATPHIFIFDEQRRLRFEGRIDDNQRESLVKKKDAREALDALLANHEPAVTHTAVFGCSTKWKSQVEDKQKETKQWRAQAVTLEPATAETLKRLRANPTGKTLLVNFWATWCGPCVAEYDDLLETYLWYRSREFELVTVSTNAPDERAAVLKFLEEHHSAVRNLQFASADVYALQEAFDKRWDSGVPYTVVIAPDGKVIYEEVGSISLLELRRSILAHLPDMGYVGNAAYWANR